eukprot:g7532.t1
MGQVKSKVPKDSDRAMKYLQDNTDFHDVNAIYNHLKGEGNTLDKARFSAHFKFDEKMRDHIFEVFDTNGDGVLDVDEFVQGIAMCSSNCDLDEKMKFCFRVFDLSGDGYLDKEELQHCVTNTAYSSFAILTAASQQISEVEDGARRKKLHPYERLVGKTAFKEEVRWMVEQAYKNSDLNDDQKLSYAEFFSWASKTPEVSNLLYSLFQMRNEKSVRTDMGKINEKVNSANALWDLDDEDETEQARHKRHGKGARISPEPLQIETQNILPGQLNNTPKSKSGKKMSLQRSPTMSAISKMNSLKMGTKRARIKNEEVVSRQLSSRDFALKGWRKWGNILFMVSVLGIVLMVIEREILHYVYFDQDNEVSTIFRFGISTNCLITSFCVIMYWNKYIEVLKIQGNMFPRGTICNTGWVFRTVCFHILICCIHVPPYLTIALNSNKVMRYWITSILSWGMLLRLYQLPMLVQQNFIRHYISVKLEVLAKMAGVTFDGLFTIRAYLRIKPYKIIAIFMFIWAIIATFLLEESESGLECIEKTSSNKTIIANVVDMRGDLDLYDGDCHYRQAPFLGWLYYSLNLLLVVNPLRIPMSVAGNTMNTISGAGSIVIFAILISAISSTLQPTTSEMRVIRHISENVQNTALRHEAVSYIQRFWRLSIKLKKRALKRMSPETLAEYQSTSSLKERIRIMDHVLATQGGCFGSSSAKEIRASMELSLMRWRLAKRKAKHLPVLANVSWHVSDLLDDLDSVKENKAALDLTISEAKMEINTAVQKVNEKIRLLRSKLGIEYNSDTFRVG